MGFYIGYALSLFGRRQDRLSHVLVNDPFENNINFFYPTLDDHWIDGPAGKINAKDAEVMLADIPFVRMRNGMPKMMLHEKGSYLQAVEQTQLQLADWLLEIDLDERTIRCGNSLPIRLKPQQFALYCAMAKLKEADASVRKDCAEDMANLADLFCYFYEKEREKGYRNSLQLDNFSEMRRILQEGSANISRVLKNKLGDYAALFRIVSQGRNTKKKYALILDKEKIIWRGRM